MSCLDLIVLMDQIKQVQLLTLILMQPFGLDIIQRICGNLYLLGLPEPVCQRLLILLFYPC